MYLVGIIDMKYARIAIVLRKLNDLGDYTEEYHMTSQLRPAFARQTALIPFCSN